MLVRLDHLGVVEHVADVRDGEQRLDAAGAVGEDAQSAGGRDGGGGGVAHLRAPPCSVIDAALEVREDAALFSQLHPNSVAARSWMKDMISSATATASSEL